MPQALLCHECDEFLSKQRRYALIFDSLIMSYSDISYARTDIAKTVKF